MDDMRYKIFNSISGKPLAYTDDITAAVTLLTHYTGQNITAAISDQIFENIL